MGARESLEKKCVKNEADGRGVSWENNHKDGKRNVREEWVGNGYTQFTLLPIKV